MVSLTVNGKQERLDVDFEKPLLRVLRESEAGAAGRAMLVAPPADRWGVDEETCHTETGVVAHLPSNRPLTKGKLAGAAADMQLRAPFLKKPHTFYYIGRPVRRLPIRLGARD